MSWPHLANPAGAWLLLASVPILALYLLRHKRPPRKIPALLLFRRTERDRRAQKNWRRLLPELSLLLQLLLVITTALLAVRPTWDDEHDRRGTLAVVLDVSASMAARDVKGDVSTRMARAKAEAQLLLDEHADGTVFLLLAGAEARLAAGRDARTLRAELAAQDAEDTGADLVSAVALADEKLRGAPNPRIVVLTDIGSSYETARPHVEVRRIGSPVDNVGVYGARATRHADGGLDLSAVVIGFAREERDVRVELRAAATVDGRRYDRDGPPLDVRVVHLLPRQRTSVRFVIPAREAEGAYELALEAGVDALERDDRAFALVPASAKLPVLVVGEAATQSAVARALSADPRLALSIVSANEYGRIDVPNDALEVFLDGCPANRRGRDAVVFGPAPGRCLDVDVAEPSRELRTLNGFRMDDPRTRFLSFDDVHAEVASTLRPRGGEGILAEDRRGALIVDASTPARMVTMLGFSLDRSDFAHKRSFVVFLRNLTELAERHRARPGQRDLHAGQAASLAVPEQVSALTFDGDPLLAHGGEVVVPARTRAGLAVLAWSDPRVGAQLVPIAFGEPLESDLLASGRPAVEPRSRFAVEPPALARWLGLHTRALLALCVLLLLTTELIVFARRPRWLT